MTRWSLALLVVIAAAIAADEPNAQQKQQLSKLQSLVGSWRGVGQPQRGSTKDSWIEEADWAWNFDQPQPALVAKLRKAKYFNLLRLTSGPDSDQFIISATPASGGETVRYTGQLDEQRQLALTADVPQGDLPRRLSFRFVAGDDRLLLLLEKKAPTGDQLVRLAEIGYTRQGSGFGKNIAQRECIVTGGAGTIEVTHNGKAYHVCCTGCRDYFNDNAEKVLAEFAERKAAEKKKK